MRTALLERIIPTPEDPLVARYRAGDIDAFGRIFALHENLVFHCAYHLMGHYDNARDICQETFLRAYQARTLFQGRCRIETWLLQICRNLCRDRLRSWSYRSEVLCDPQTARVLAWGDPNQSSPDPFRAVERSETAALVHRALQRLPLVQREILVLRDLEDLSVKETAAVLGCSPGHVNVRLFRARRRLQDVVEALLKENEK